MPQTKATDPAPHAQQVNNPPYLARLDFEPERLILTVLKNPYRLDLKLCLTQLPIPIVPFLCLGFVIDLLTGSNELRTLLLWPITPFIVYSLLILLRTIPGLVRERVFVFDKASGAIKVDGVKVGRMRKVKAVRIRTSIWSSHRRFRLYLILTGNREILILQTNLLAGLLEQMQFFSDLSLEENIYLPRFPLWTDYKGEKWGFDPKDREIFTIAEQLTNYVQEYQSRATATAEKMKPSS